MFPRKSFPKKTSGKNGARKDVKTRKPEKAAESKPEAEANHGAARHDAGSFSFAYLKALHKQNAAESFRRLWQAPVSTLLNSLMIGVAFALPGPDVSAGCQPGSVR